MVLYSVKGCGTVLSDVGRNAMVREDDWWHVMILTGLKWYAAVRYGVEWCRVARDGG